MGIWDRLGTVINSYFTDFESDTASRLRSPRRSSGDSDFDAAFEELNDFLNGDSRIKKTEHTESSRSYSWKDADASYEEKKYSERTSTKKTSYIKLPPEELREDFEILGVPFGANEEICKTAYKNLLKTHHPDKHAGHAGNYKKATAKTAKINAAWDRIENWRQSQEGK